MKHTHRHSWDRSTGQLKRNTYDQIRAGVSGQRRESREGEIGNIKQIRELQSIIRPSPRHWRGTFAQLEPLSVSAMAQNLATVLCRQVEDRLDLSGDTLLNWNRTFYTLINLVERIEHPFPHRWLTSDSLRCGRVINWSDKVCLKAHTSICIHPARTD
jgi:hypothetical protein